MIFHRSMSDERVGDSRSRCGTAPWGATRAGAASRRAPTGAAAWRRRRSSTGYPSNRTMSVASAVRPWTAFEQVVTDQCVLRDASLEAAHERVDVVDALADVDPRAEQVLIQCRRPRGCRCRSPTSPAKIRENRVSRELEGDVSMRGWTIVYPEMTRPVVGIEDGAVERMREQADQAVRRFLSEARVSLSRVMTKRIPSSPARVADMASVARVIVPAQQAVELLELAALALPAHEALFCWIPARLAVQQMKRAGSVVAVLGVERRDALGRAARGARRSWAASSSRPRRSGARTGARDRGLRGSGARSAEPSRPRPRAGRAGSASRRGFGRPRGCPLQSRASAGRAGGGRAPTSTAKPRRPPPMTGTMASTRANAVDGDEAPEAAAYHPAKSSGSPSGARATRDTKAWARASPHGERARSRRGGTPFRCSSTRRPSPTR